MYHFKVLLCTDVQNVRRIIFLRGGAVRCIVTLEQMLAHRYF